MARHIKAFSGVEKLTKDHDLKSFSCNRPALDEWLKKYALTAQASDSAKTYVVHKDNAVLGYYALTAGCIKVAEATGRAGAGQPRAGSVAIALLARLAVDQTVQGQGLGCALLKDALIRCENAADIIGVRAVLVHALDDEAKAFYTKFGFEASPVDDMTLMLMMKDIRGAMG